MLCAHEDIPESGYPMVAEPKLDGWRMVFYIDAERNVTVCSRGGKTEPYTRNLRHVSDALVSFGFSECMVDGEIGAESWNEVARLARLKDPTEAQMEQIRRRVVFDVFDLVLDRHLAEGETSRGKATRFARSSWDERRFELELRVPEAHPVVRVVPHRLVHSQAEAAEAHRQHCAGGYEGTVLKQPYAHYDFDRSRQWLAIKPIETVDGQIVEVREGEGKHAGRLGALVVRLQDGVVASFGTGYTDAERIALWAQRASLPGRWIEGTRQVGDVAVARHPVFVKMRPDKD